MADPEIPQRLIPRSLAAGVLIALVAAGALTAWLVLHGDFARARPEPTAPPPTASGVPPTP